MNVRIELLHSLFMSNLKESKEKNNVTAKRNIIQRNDTTYFTRNAGLQKHDKLRSALLFIILRPEWDPRISPTIYFLDKVSKWDRFVLVAWNNTVFSSHGM